jgi:hypothetical protein
MGSDPFVFMSFGFYFQNNIYKNQKQTTKATIVTLNANQAKLKWPDIVQTKLKKKRTFFHVVNMKNNLCLFN